MNEDQLQNRNEWAEEKKRNQLIEERKFMWSPEQVGRIASAAGFAHGMAVADIGCGLGYLGMMYWKHFGKGGRYIGVDCSEALLKEAGELAAGWASGGTATFLNGSAYGIPLADNSVDVAMCQTLLIHLEFPLKAILEMKRITKPGGIVMCKDVDNISNYWKRSYSTALDCECIEDMLFKRRMKEIWAEGRRKLGKGDWGIGTKIPRMMYEAGLISIEGVCNERLQFLQPPYTSPEQQLRVQIIKNNSGEDTPEEKQRDKEEFRKYHLAGGGSDTSFEEDFGRLVDLQEKQSKLGLDQLSDGTLFACSGGSAFFCVYGRKPLKGSHCGKAEVSSQFQISLRKALVTDAAAIADIHVKSWRSAYSGIIPRSYLDALSINQRRKMWENILSQSGENALIAEDRDCNIIGFASFGPSRDDDSHCTGEVYGIYVDSLWWGKGCGRKLLRASEIDLKSQGFCSATLWVFQANKKARRFYETAGYEADGSAKTVTIADTELVELKYRKSLEFTG